MSKREALHERRPLTEAEVKNLKLLTDRQYENHYDALVPGLVLRVNSGGAKVWHALWYRPSVNKDGKRISVPTTRRLGRYPVLGVKEARVKARQFLGDTEKALAQSDTDTFKEVAENFIKRHVNARKDRPELRSKKEILRSLDKYIYPQLQHRPFREIKRREVGDLLDHIQDNHGPRQADTVLALLSKMMNWYATRDDNYVTPLVRGMQRCSPADRARSRILNDDEIRAVWKAADGMGTFGALVKVLLLTAQRLRKVSTMQWSHVVDGEWKIATEPREKSNAGSLRLPTMVLDIINAQPRLAGNPYVFTAGHGNGPFRSFERKLDLARKLPAGTPPWVLHDLRRTARSLMSRAEVRPDVAERVLGHAIPGVKGVYDRHRYDIEKADALNRLADLVETILNPPEGNVVKLPRRKRTR